MPTEEPAESPSLGDLFVAEESALLRYAFGLSGRRAVAEEIVQEAFLRLHRQWEEVEHSRAWLYRCVRNLALNEIRDHARETLSPDGADEPSDNEAPDETLGRLEAVGALRLLLAELPAADAQLIHLKYLDRKSYATIAEKTGVNIGTVGYRLHHILRDLAASLRGAGVESSLG